MLKELKFTIYSIKKNIQNSAELRTSFLMNIIGMTINNIAFVFLWIYFVKSVGIIGGWTTYDIVGMNGLCAISYGLVVSVGMGIRKLPESITSGAFDRYMISPKNLLLRVITSSISTSAIGDIIFGIICLAIYGFLIKITVIQIVLLLILVILSSFVILSALIVIYSFGFYFTDGSTISEGIFQLFFTPTLFHGGAFQGVMRFIFTFLIPSLLVAAIPIELIKNVSFDKLLLTIILTIAWLVISIKFFKRSVKRYESSNFMTFGQ
jgi:ABC-2 type transport system permease protein